MILTFRLGRYELSPAPPSLPKAWKRAGAKAFTIDPFAANEFIKCADDQARLRIGSLVQTTQDALVTSWAMDSDFEFSLPPGEVARGYQKAGVKFMFEREASLNADAPRLGKSLQAIGVFNKMDAQKCIVVCPANAKPQWKSYFKRWGTNIRSIQVVRGISDLLWGDVLIFNWDILARYSNLECDLLIGDEIRAAKNEKSARTQAFYAIKCKKLIGLDGTPINTRPIDLWPLVKRCDPLGLGKNRKEFVLRYCGGRQADGSYDELGASNMEELQRRMRTSFMIRREKQDVQAEITSSRQMVWLPNDDVIDLLATELAGFRNGQPSTRSLEDIIRERVDDPNYTPSPEVLTAREALARAKIPHVVDYVTKLLQDVPKVIIFAHHRSVTTGIAAHFPGASVIVGGITPKQRQEQIDRFQNDPEVSVFVGNITACNSAISLAAADDVVFAELSWVPTEMAQAEERPWLPGKENALTMHWLMFDSSLDAAMHTVLIDRLANVSKAMDRAHVMKVE